MNKEILCKCLLERKDEILVFTNFTSLVLISTMIALLVILFINQHRFSPFLVFLEVKIGNSPGPTGASKCPSDSQLIDRPTKNLLFATLNEWD